MAPRSARDTAGVHAGEHSWFGATGPDESHEDDAVHSRLDRGEWRASDAPDSHFISRQAQRIASAGPSGTQRLYRAFVAARAALSLALLGTEIAATWFGSRSRDDLALPLCSVYAFAAIVLWLLPPRGTMAQASEQRLRRSQWLVTIGVDMVVFAALRWWPAAMDSTMPR